MPSIPGEWSILGLSVTTVSIIYTFMPIVLQKTFHRWSHEWELEQITFDGCNWSTSEYRQYFGLHTARTRGISRFCTEDSACTPRISGFDTAGTPCTRGSVLLILPVLAVFGRSVLLILAALAVFRPPVLQYSQYSEHETYSILPGILGV